MEGHKSSDVDKERTTGIRKMDGWTDGRLNTLPRPTGRLSVNVCCADLRALVGKGGAGRASFPT